MADLASTRVFGKLTVVHDAILRANAEIAGNTHVAGNAEIVGDMQVAGNVHMTSNQPEIHLEATRNDASGGGRIRFSSAIDDTQGIQLRYSLDNSESKSYGLILEEDTNNAQTSGANLHITGIYHGNGSGLTDLDSSKLSGTVPNSRLPTTAIRWPKWDEVTEKPSTFSPSSHTHAAHEVKVLGNRLTIESDGKIVVNNSGYRQAGMYGSYDSAKIGHIWSMGSQYAIDSDGSTFGTLYGIAYKHTNNPTGGAMGGGHQMVWVANGVPRCSLGDNIWSSGNITAYSDIRVKTNIRVIPNALEKVCKLNGYTFDRTDVISDEPDGSTKPLRQTGVIAQEVLEVLPEAVTGGPTENDPDGHYSVAYGNLVGLLIEAIKEERSAREALGERLEKLMAEVRHG